MDDLGQSIPPEQAPHADERDRMLDSDEIHTLEHGGYGGEGELEYTERAPQAARQAGEYLNQTDMTDETGDRSLSEQAERSQFGDERITDDTERGNQ